MRYILTLVISAFTFSGLLFSQTTEENDSTIVINHEDSIVVSESSYFADSLKFYDFISPNDDGHNDYFVIDYIEFFPDSELLIYNLNGDLVYRNSNYQNEFEGRANAGLIFVGQALPDGIYYYTLIDTLRRKHSGKFTIKR